MADQDDKKTRKEGLSEEAKRAIEEAKKETGPSSERDAAVLADKLSDHAAAKPMKGTPHGKDDVDEHGKPTPTADSDDEAPLRTFGRIDEEDREHGAHRGPGREIRRKGPKPVRKRTALLLAEYDTPADCMHAAETLRDAGYTSFDAHTPFPVHGMDAAMGLPDSKLGWIVLVCGLTGTTAAFAMMYWMNCVDYPLIVGGKPPNIASIPSMIPIMFELTVLLGSFGAVLGMFHLNRLPRHNHPIFESDRFGGFSDDKFYISVEAEDPKFKLDRTRELLDKTHPTFIEIVEEEI